MVDLKHEPKGRTAIREMTEEDFDGFDLADIKCRSCSGYGNCGFKTYGIYQGKAVSICNQRKYQLQCERGWAVSQRVRMLQRAYAATRATAAAVQPLCCRDAAGQRCRAAAMRRNAARQRRDIATGQDNAAASPWEEPHIMRTSPHGECPVVVVLRCSSRFGVRVSNVCGFLPKISL